MGEIMLGDQATPLELVPAASMDNATRRLGPRFGVCAYITKPSQYSQLSGGLLRALDETGRLSVVCLGQSNYRTAVLGPDAYRVRHVCSGYDRWEISRDDGRRRGTAGDGTNDVS